MSPLRGRCAPGRESPILGCPPLRYGKLHWVNLRLAHGPTAVVSPPCLHLPRGGTTAPCGVKPLLTCVSQPQRDSNPCRHLERAIGVISPRTAPCICAGQAGCIRPAGRPESAQSAQVDWQMDWQDAREADVSDAISREAPYRTAGDSGHPHRWIPPVLGAEADAPEAAAEWSRVGSGSADRSLPGAN